MIIQKAVQHAIEGGYTYKGDTPLFDDNIDSFVITDGNGGYVIPYIEVFLLDTKFWQALGKSMGWGFKLEYNVCDCHVGEYYSYKFCPKCGKELKLASKTSKEWKEKWHKFIDHLADGGTIEGYFKSLT